MSCTTLVNVSDVKYELKSAGVNVVTPVELLYDNEPVPLALAVVTLKSVSAAPPPAGPVAPCGPLMLPISCAELLE